MQFSNINTLKFYIRIILCIVNLSVRVTATLNTNHLTFFYMISRSQFYFSHIIILISAISNSNIFFIKKINI